MHQLISGLQNVAGARNYVCPRCIRRANRDPPVADDIVLSPGDDEVIRETESFCYLGDVVDREGGVERAIHARVAAAWTKWRGIAGLLCSSLIPLKNRSHIYMRLATVLRLGQ